MTNPDQDQRKVVEEIMRDPVDYLAGLGIEAEVVAETTLAAAA